MLAAKNTSADSLRTPRSSLTISPGRKKVGVDGLPPTYERNATRRSGDGRSTNVYVYCLSRNSWEILPFSAGASSSGPTFTVNLLTFPVTVERLLLDVFQSQRRRDDRILIYRFPFTPLRADFEANREFRPNSIGFCERI